MNRTLIVGLALLFVAGGVLSIVTATAIYNRRKKERQPRPNVYEHGNWQQKKLLKDFILTNQDGAKFKSDTMKDRVCVVSFFFAMCPSVCAQQNRKVAALQNQLGPQGVHFISITCDPERDTPQALKLYSQKFTDSNKHWTFLTGELEHIRRIGAEVFGVPLAKATHTSHLLLVDKWGKVRGRYLFNDEKQIDTMIGEVGKLQKETEPPPPPKPSKRRMPNIRLDDDDLDDDDDDDSSSKAKQETKLPAPKKTKAKPAGTSKN